MFGLGLQLAHALAGRLRLARGLVCLLLCRLGRVDGVGDGVLVLGEGRTRLGVEVLNGRLGLLPHFGRCGVSLAHAHDLLHVVAVGDGHLLLRHHSALAW